MAKDKLHCSFCHKSQDEVVFLVCGGEKLVFICDECIELCIKVIFNKLKKDYAKEENQDG